MTFERSNVPTSTRSLLRCCVQYRKGKGCFFAQRGGFISLVTQRQFTDYIAEHPFNGDQIRFLRAVQAVFTQKRRLQPADLYAAPLTAFGQDAVERWFSPEQVEDVLAFAKGLEV